MIQWDEYETAQIYLIIDNMVIKAPSIMMTILWCQEDYDDGSCKDFIFFNLTKRKCCDKKLT